jgi:apolipoprotein N-acyltransferase
MPQAHAPSSNLVVWPEGALPFYFDQAPGYMCGAQTYSDKQSDSTIVTGMPTRAGSDRFNSIVSVGQSSQTYNKQKLVPFGEFVPLEDSLRGVIDFFRPAYVQFLKR